MSILIDETDLAPLMDLAREQGDLRLRCGALEALARMPVKQETLTKVIQLAEHAAGELSPEAYCERSLLGAARRVPGRDLSTLFRLVPMSPARPDADWVQKALLTVHDPAQIGYATTRLTQGDSIAYEQLAGMALENLALRPDQIPQPGYTGDAQALADQRFWWALARARLNDFGALETWLRGEAGQPAFLQGPPDLAYAKLAGLRPLPEQLVAFLRRVRDSGTSDAETDFEVHRQLVIDALTGLADWEGTPLEPPGVADAEEPEPAALATDFDVELARDVARRIQAEDGVSLLDLDRDALVHLPADEVPNAVMGIVQRAEREAEVLDTSVGADFMLGNKVVELIDALPSTENWPVGKLVEAQLGQRYRGLDPGQFTHVIARAGPAQVMGTVRSLLQVDETPAGRKRLLGLVGEVADEWAGRAGSPYRGAGGGGELEVDLSALQMPLDADEQTFDMTVTDDVFADEAPDQAEPILLEEVAAEPADDEPVAAVDFAAPTSTTEGRAEADIRTVERIPHMDLSREVPLAPGIRFEISIWADREAARTGERSERISLEVPRSVTEIELEASVFVSSHLEIVGPMRRQMRLWPEQKRSEVIRFELQVRERDALRGLSNPGEARISVVFSWNGRPGGQISRQVDLDLITPEAGTEVGDKHAPDTGIMRLDGSAVPSDITVHVKAHPDNDGRKFYCRVTSPHLPEAEDPGYVPWNLPAVTSEIVAAYMENFIAAGTTPISRVLELEGAGSNLFKAAPDRFKTVYWALVDAGTPPRSIAIISEEPYIPWELMKPERPDSAGAEVKESLGVSATVGRWISVDSLPAPQKLSLSDSLVIAPRYQGGDALVNAEDEVALVLDHYSGQRVDPATVDSLYATFKHEAPSLLHFVCHGLADSAVQTVKLEERQTLTATALEGLVKRTRYFSSHHTLVVLNACEVGRPAPALVGIDGFARTLAEAGAAAVIATLWSVKDNLAHEVARDFYAAIKADPKRPYADILREIRRRSYDMSSGEDTYAAYCFYGDPLASG